MKTIVGVLLIIVMAVAGYYKITHKKNSVLLVKDEARSSRPTLRVDIPKNVTLVVSFPRTASNRVFGDFTKVEFLIEDNHDASLVEGVMDCDTTPSKTDCSTTDSIANLAKNKIYRIIIKNHDGLLGSELFEYTPTSAALIINIDNDSTGDYLVSRVSNATAYNKSEIYDKLISVLGGDHDDQYDLEKTMYNLFIHYDGYKDYKKALNEIIHVLQTNAPVVVNEDNSETMKFFSQGN